MQSVVELTRDLLRFKGRIKRLTYWRRELLLTVLAGVVLVVGTLAVIGVGPFGGIAFLPMVLIFVAHLANTVRRLQDRDRGLRWVAFFMFGSFASLGFAAAIADSDAAGLGVVLYLVCLAVSIWGLVEIGFRRGTPGSNRFGPAPA